MTPRQRLLARMAGNIAGSLVCIPDAADTIRLDRDAMCERVAVAAVKVARAILDELGVGKEEDEEP